MSVTDDIEKKFVIKHVFKDVMNMKVGDKMDGPIEYHYSIPWRINLDKSLQSVNIYLESLTLTKCTGWSIDTSIIAKLAKTSGESATLIYDKRYKSGNTFHQLFWIYEHNANIFIVDGKVTVEFQVDITKMTGNFEKKKLRNFDDELAKKHSDVVLIVGDQKFHVYKAYLATHSTYFDALLMGNFAESGKSEIELKDIDPNDFQNFLELIYGELLVDDFSVLGILHLADFFDSKTAIRRCDEFLGEKSNLPLKDRFHAAIMYKMDKLKEKCMSEMKTKSDFLAVVPEDPSQFDYSLWKEFFLKFSTL